MEEKIKELIKLYEKSVEEIEEWKGDDFDPMDASGGNFDDAYYLGLEHGEAYGKLEALRELLQ